jgi:hypothetical protein
MSIAVEHLFHIYAPNTPMETEALSDICMEVREGAHPAANASA